MDSYCNSKMYHNLSSIAKRRSGRNWSPARTEGLIKTDRFTYSLGLSTLSRPDAREFKTELCLHVNLPSPRYVLHPELTCKSGAVGR